MRGRAQAGGAQGSGGWQGSGLRRLGLLLLLAVGGNLVMIHPLPGVNLMFGSIAVLVILRTYGLAWGLLAALGAGGVAAWIWGHPAVLLVFGLEVVVVSVLLARLDDNVALVDAGYWLLVGIPLALWTASAYPPPGWIAPAPVALKLGVNGVFNAVVANVLLDHTPLGVGSRTAPLRRHLFNVLVVLVLGTSFFMTVVDTREELSHLYAEHVDDMDAAERRLEDRLRRWANRPMRILSTLASEVDFENEDQERLQARLDSFLGLSDAVAGLYLVDVDGRLAAVAAHDRVHAAAFQQRRPLELPRVDEVLHRRRPVVSGLVPPARADGQPLLIFVGPVRRNGPEGGLAVLAADIDDLRNLLHQLVRGTRFRAVVVDPGGRVVASSDPGLPAMARYHPYQKEARAAWPRWTGRWSWPMGEARQVRALNLGAPTWWTLHLDVSLAPVQDYLNRRIGLALGFMLGLTLLVLPVAAWASDWITLPLQRLAARSTDVPLRLEKGEPMRWPGSRVQEINAVAANFEQMTDALQQRMRALSAADRAKDDFLATLGHELRNPLAPIAHAVTLLRMAPSDTANVERLAGVLERQSGHLARLVDDLLDLSRIARGKIELREAVVDLRQAVRGALDGVRPEARRAGQEIVLQLPGAPVWVRGDETRLEQVVSNLLTNAVKYTPAQGRIEVRLTAEASARLVVQDTGIGMDRELLARAFEPFQQGTPPGRRARGGLGVGLTLVRQLVGLHHGRVRALSEGPGKGTRVEVELPLVVAPESLEVEMPVEEAGAAVAPKRVLVVDDNADAAELMAELMRSWGHQVQTAEDGPEALDQLRAHPADVVLLDIGLPSMSGYEVARAIRGDPSLGRPVLIAVTGFGQDQDRARSQGAGFDDHLVKPVDLEVLERILASVKAGDG